MTFGTLRLRLLLAGAISTALALALAGYGLAVLFERHAEHRIDAELSVYVNQLAAHLEPDPAGGLTLSVEPGDPRFEDPLSGLYWQILHDPTGKVLRSRSLWDTELSLPPEKTDDLIHHHRIPGPDKSELYLLQRRVVLSERLGGGTARIAVAWDTAEISKAVRQFAADLAPLLAVIGILLLAASWLQVTVGLQPLSAIRARLAAVRTGKSQRLGSEFPSEVKPLATEIDELLDTRDAELTKARTRAADLAHGLRTPLQVLRMEIEKLSKAGHAGFAQELDHAADTMHRHVEREIARARLATSQKNATAIIYPVIERIIRVVQHTPDGHRLEWQTDVPTNFAARIDRDDLAEALGNLIENAARFARNEVIVSATIEDNFILIIVADDGPGLPEERQADALRRGVRLDERGTGAGLGLAIVSDIIETWGGTFTLENGEPGLRAILRIPRVIRD